MCQRPSVYSHQRQFPKDLASGNLTFSGAGAKTLTFKDASGNAKKAEKVIVYIEDTNPGGTIKNMFFRMNGVADNACFKVPADQHVFMVECTCATFSMYADSADMKARVWSFATEDISGTTVA